MLEAANLSPDDVRAMPDSHPLAPLIDAMQGSMAAYLQLFDGLPGIVLTERDDVGWFVGTSGWPGREVLWSRFDAATSDAQIDRVLSELGAHCSGLDWAVYRSCRPLDLGARLEAKGLKRGFTLWMLADLADLPALAPPDPDFRVELVTNEEELREWWHVSAAGYESRREDIEIFHDAYRQHPFGPDMDCVHRIGYWRDEPVTSATLLLASGIAGIYAVSTAPAHRRRGFGAAITRASLETARARGYRYACLQSSAMGVRVYERVGFNVKVFLPEYAWKKR